MQGYIAAVYVCLASEKTLCVIMTFDHIAAP